MHANFSLGIHAVFQPYICGGQTDVEFSFIHLLIIPECITGTEPMDIEHVITCIELLII